MLLYAKKKLIFSEDQRSLFCPISSYKRIKTPSGHVNFRLRLAVIGLDFDNSTFRVVSLQIRVISSSFKMSQKIKAGVVVDVLVRLAASVRVFL